MDEQGLPEQTYPTVSQQELRHREDLAGRLAALEATVEFEKRVTRIETTQSMLKWGIGLTVSLIAAAGIMLGSLSQLANLIRALSGQSPRN